ncbi:MAG: histidine phosphatase family protein [Hyphomicrobiales bacterium]
MRLPALALAALAVLAAAPPQAAEAAPSRIILLRHGEKAKGWTLCPTGELRAQALAKFYLGKGAQDSLFEGRDPPVAFLAITPHTLGLAAPAAISWGLPVATYAVLPSKGTDADEKDAAFTAQTQQAATDVLSNPAYTGKTVVMVWEHHHIADAKLDKHAGAAKVTLRALFGLDALPGVPKTWPGDTYDYFWIVDLNPATGAPKHFEMVKQQFPAPFNSVPSNDWGAPDSLTAESGCAL